MALWLVLTKGMWAEPVLSQGLNTTPGFTNSSEINQKRLFVLTYQHLRAFLSHSHLGQEVSLF